MPITAYKWIAAIVFLSGLFGAGYFWGYRHEHDAFVAYRAAVDASAKEQAAAAALKEKEQNEQTETVTRSYADELNRLHRVLARVQHDPAGSCDLPSTSGSAKSSDGTSSQFGLTRQSADTGACLEDALKVRAWQEWAIRQHIPVQ